MISLEKCTKVLNSGGERYDKKEVAQIRDFLYKMGGLIYEVYKANQKASEAEPVIERKKTA